jgi:hypothetical protein
VGPLFWGVWWGVLVALVPPLPGCCPVGCDPVLVGWFVCELDSGREHLRVGLTMVHTDLSHPWICWGWLVHGLQWLCGWLVLVWGVGVFVVFVECL